jgi:hypothetical protein
MNALERYIQLSAVGIKCLPVGQDKLPAIPKGESWIGGWLNKTEYQKANGIAIIAGLISGNIECIDFDNHFGDAKKVISDFSKIDGVKDIISKLPIQSTQSGGYHIIYRCDKISGNQKLASRPVNNGTAQKYDILIETRGEGGYFVIDPTPGYKIIHSDLNNIPVINAEQRELLFLAAKSFNQKIKTTYQAEESDNKPGDVFNNDPSSIDEMKDVLRDNGWIELGDNAWRRPGKNKGISATLGRAANGIFYNFSSSADPFESDKGYTAFQVLGLLKYNGDFKKLAKDLAEKYNLKPELKHESIDNKQNTLNIDAKLKKAYIDLEIPIEKPPVILRIKTRSGINYNYNRVLTLGNFSAIKGKSKSKKTFLTSIFLAACTKNGYMNPNLLADIPKNKTGVVLFDTEQSPYDAYITARRVWTLGGGKYSNFGAFDLREYTPFERCEIIDAFFNKAGSQTSFVVIDGIADLANAINDEIEASRVVNLLMKWTKIYNTHIQVVIHENKNDNFATGHLGSAILKKAECVISVTKDVDDNLLSEVSCDLIRGVSEFDKFKIKINDNGLPEIEFANSSPEADVFIKDY